MPIVGEVHISCGRTTVRDRSTFVPEVLLVAEVICVAERHFSCLKIFLLYTKYVPLVAEVYLLLLECLLWAK